MKTGLVIAGIDPALKRLFFSMDARVASAHDDSE
jgi:hypothetical protein